MSDEEIINKFKGTNKSPYAFSVEHGISYCRIRKVLVNAGLIELNPTAKSVRHLYSQGYGAVEIAEELGLSVPAVSIYIPRRRVEYDGKSTRTKQRKNKNDSDE